MLERPVPAPEYFPYLAAGDVLRWPSGDLRLVRDVKRARHGYACGRSGPCIDSHLSVTLAIRRCSWTRRPYTVLTKNDLRRLKVVLVARGRDIRGTKLERDLLADIQHKCCIGPSQLTCCDVDGLP